MENPTVLVLAVALSPFIVAGLVWFGISLAQAAGERRRMVSSMGSGVVVSHRWRALGRLLAGATAVVVGLTLIVAPMSPLGAWMLGFVFLGGRALLVARGGLEPSFGIDDRAFDRELRSFLDDAA